MEELQSRQQSQKKKINPKVLNMIEKWGHLDAQMLVQSRANAQYNAWITHSVEKKEKELVKMHSQVLKDKLKIEETINKLIDHKRDALQKTWQKVNGCVFGEITAPKKKRRLI